MTEWKKGIESHDIILKREAEKKDAINKKICK